MLFNNKGVKRTNNSSNNYTGVSLDSFVEDFFATEGEKEKPKDTTITNKNKTTNNTSSRSKNNTKNNTKSTPKKNSANIINACKDVSKPKLEEDIKVTTKVDNKVISEVVNTPNSNSNSTSGGENNEIKVTIKYKIMDLFDKGYLNHEIIELSEKSTEFDKPLNLHSVRCYRTIWVNDNKGGDKILMYKKRMSEYKNSKSKTVRKTEQTEKYANKKREQKVDVKCDCSNNVSNENKELKEAGKTSNINTPTNTNNNVVDVLPKGLILKSTTTEYKRGNITYEVGDLGLTIKIPNYKDLNADMLDVLLDDLRFIQRGLKVQ